MRQKHIFASQKEQLTQIILQIMKISGFLIEGVLNICSLKLNLENFNALIADRKSVV